MSTNKTFEQIYQQLMSLPLWVKQVIYVVLKQDLEKLISTKTLSAFNTDDTLQLWQPQLLTEGESYLQQAQNRYDTDLLKLLYHSHKSRTVMDITILNQWTLEKACSVILDAWKQELITQPGSKIVRATVLFISGDIRIGEYLVQTDRITEAQLDQALRTQDYIAQSMDERAGIAEVMINLNYINRQDSESILFLKEESKKPFNGDAFDNLGSNNNTTGQNKEAEALKHKLTQYHQRVQQLESYIRQLQGKKKA